MFTFYLKFEVDVALIVKFVLLMLHDILTVAKVLKVYFVIECIVTTLDCGCIFLRKLLNFLGISIFKTINKCDNLVGF